MNRPRKFYGWTQDGKFRVSLLSGAEQGAANWYDTKAQAELEAIKNRTDRGHAAPSIEWEHEVA